MTTTTHTNCWNCEVGFGIISPATCNSVYGPLCDYCATQQADATPGFTTTPLATTDAVATEPSRRDQYLTPNRIIVQDATRYDIITDRTDLDSTRCLHCYSKGTRSTSEYTWESYRPANSLSRARLDRIAVCTKHAKKILDKQI